MLTDLCPPCFTLGLLSCNWLHVYELLGANFRTGQRATHMVLAGYLVPVGTVLVTPVLN